LSRLLKEILDKLAEHLDKGSWPDDETYYQARRLYYRLRTIEEKDLAESEDSGDTYGGKE